MSAPLQTRLLEQRLDYDGSQLHAHWILRQTGMRGDALVAFRGACSVSAVEMADLGDLLSKQVIAGDDMLHFVWESFDDGDLTRAVYRQRLLAALAHETLRAMADPAMTAGLHRTGDDLWVGEGKLSISVASRTLVSSLIHLGLNIDNSGTPVPTSSLSQLHIDPDTFARELLAAVAHEEASIHDARVQVRGRSESGE